MENYFVHNLETDKVNVFTTKEFYKGLPQEAKKYLVGHCLFSRTQGCWISKAKFSGSGGLRTWLTENGFTNNGSVGAELSFTDQVEKQKERAAIRSERAAVKAEKAEAASDQHYNEAKKMADVIPFGQPILVGHHSEKRDRSYRSKIHNKFGKAFEEMDKAKYYQEKSELAKYDAAGKKYSNPRYLNNRIKECQTAIRLFERRWQGKLYPNSLPQEISEKERSFYNDRLGKENEKLDYYIGCMKKINPDYEIKQNTSRNSKGKTL